MLKNECHSSYVFYTDIGNKNELLYLHNKLSGSLAEIARGVNSYGSRWLGEVLVTHGIDWQCEILPDEVFELDKSIVYGKDVVKANNRENPKISNLAYFNLQTSTRGKPPTELWEAVISQYEGVSFVYFVECEGGSRVGEGDRVSKGSKGSKGSKVGVFINSDRDGLFFSERYSLWISCNEKALNRLTSISSNDSGVLAIITSKDPTIITSKDSTSHPEPRSSTQEIQIREYFDTFEELREYFIKLAKKGFESVEQMQSHLSSIASYVNGVRNAYFMASVREYAYE